MLFVFHSYRKPRVRLLVDRVREGGLTSEKPPPSNSATLPSPEFSSIPFRHCGPLAAVDEGIAWKKKLRSKMAVVDSFYSSLHFSFPRLVSSFTPQDLNDRRLSHSSVFLFANRGIRLQRTFVSQFPRKVVA